MLAWLKHVFRKRNSLQDLSNDELQEQYLRAGGRFGDAVSYIYMGECIGFKDLLNKWANLEQEYSSRGFRTISLDDFIGYGGYGKDISHLLNQPLSDDEKPIYHAQIYEDVYLGRVRPTLDLTEMLETGESQAGTYYLPSTEEVKNDTAN